MSRSMERKVMGLIPEGAVYFSRLLSRDNDFNYNNCVYSVLFVLLIIVKYQLLVSFFTSEMETNN